MAPAGGRRGRGVGGGDGGGVPVRGGGAHGLRGEGVRGGGAHGRWVVVLEGGRRLGLGLPSVGHRGGVAAAPRQAPGGRRSPPGRCARFYASGVGGMRPGFTLSLIHDLSVTSGNDNRLKIGEISLKSTDNEGQIQISIINDLSLIIDANQSIYRKFG